MDDIEILINELEAEKAAITKLIEDAVLEDDYLTAHYHSLARGEVSTRIRTLRNFLDKNFDKKQTLKRVISRKLSYLEKGHHIRIINFLKEDIQRDENKLRALEQSDVVPVEQSTILIEALQSFIDRKIKAIDLILLKSLNFTLRIRRERSGLRISIPHLKSIRREGFIQEEELKSLMALGFRLNESETKLELELSFDKKLLLQNFNTILVKIVFEVFSYRNFSEETFLKIKE